MRVRSWGLWLGMVLLIAPCGAGAASGPRVTAKAALVMDARSGELLWAHAPDQRLPPASTTKVMTAILAIESGRLQERAVASPEACAVAPRKLSLRPGQGLVLEDLLYAILLNSANDASAVIAEHLAGSVAAFGKRMTARARQLGARHTHFVNPHGLTAPGHYSTVRDLATIFRHALDLPKFRKVLATKSTMITVENPRRNIVLHSHNRLLDKYKVPVIGKTGYTRPAKRCFVGAAQDGEREIIIALLGSNDLWGDARRLIEYGLERTSVTRPDAQQVDERTRPSAAPVQDVVRAPGRSTATARRTPVYAVHVGTFDRIDRARRLQRALGRRGFSAAIDSIATGTGKDRHTQYRVEIGPYANRDQAESAVRTMAGQIALPTQIVQR
jgi:serine-type D-Ala-D-Ala carboxypeptidase (penicillin-binding protein 5/6)